MNGSRTSLRSSAYVRHAPVSAYEIINPPNIVSQSSKKSVNQAESLSSNYFIIIIFQDGSFLYGKLLVMYFFTLDNI